jgi:ribonucleoside-diphosphate reductase alpha chain
MHRVMVGADPDAPPRLVTLPAAWDDTAAAALAALVPGEQPVMLATAADAWIRPIAERALRAGLEMPLSERLHRMLLLRHGSPSAPIWQGRDGTVPGFVLNLASFHDADAGFDTPAFIEAIETAVTTLTLAAPAAPRLAVGVTDLAGLLALLGVEYGSGASLAIARGLAALLRGRAEAASGALARLFGIWRSAIAGAGRSSPRRAPVGCGRGGPAAHRAHRDC